MKRIEIIANASIEEDLFEQLHKNGVGSHYSKIYPVYGAGDTNPALGDSVWPETNLILLFYCENSDVDKIYKAVQTVKKQFPTEGVKMFKVEAHEA